MSKLYIFIISFIFFCILAIAYMVYLFGKQKYENGYQYAKKEQVIAINNDNDKINKIIIKTVKAPTTPTSNVDYARLCYPTRYCN